MVCVGRGSLTMTIELPRKAKGRRPSYFDDPGIERVLAITLALAGEVSVLRDRIDTIERLSAKGKPFGPAEVDGFTITAEIARLRDEQRTAFLDQVLLVIQQDVEELEKRPIKVSILLRSMKWRNEGPTLLKLCNILIQNVKSV